MQSDEWLMLTPGRQNRCGVPELKGWQRPGGTSEAAVGRKAPSGAIDEECRAVGTIFPRFL